ncbi:hypothetical protein MKW92_033652 [Papaver armeniacum]|nr:hypothetical protein MKW92_033652 [Papaver armeniacum]
MKETLPTISRVSKSQHHGAGDQKMMDKSNGGGGVVPYRYPSWFVIFASFNMLWFLMFYFNTDAFVSSKNKVQSIMNDYVYGFVSPQPKIMFPVEDETAVPLFGEPIRDDDLVDRFGTDDSTSVSLNDQPEAVRQEEVVVSQNQSKTEDLPSQTELVGENVSRPEPEEPTQKNEIQPISDPNKNETLTIEPVSENGSDTKTENPIRENENEPVDTKLIARNGTEPITQGDPVTEDGIEPIVHDLNEPVPRNESESEVDPCTGKYIYMHDLPKKFNEDLLVECDTLNKWIPMCPYMANGGLGPRLVNSQGVFPTNGGWFNTDQYMLEVIFHHRMQQYKCLTLNSSLASAIYVPFYAGFEVIRHLWDTDVPTRDAATLELVKWLTSKPEWKVLGGRDHFLVPGRTTWDFRRLSENDEDWGNKLLVLPETEIMPALLVEASPWQVNDFGLPFPTYFHPSSDGEVYELQNRMRNQQRRFLFSFVGAPRPNNTKSIRNQLIEQCLGSKNCKQQDCRNKENGEKPCEDPSTVMKVFQRSVFCLEPQGDSATRRSTFDAILAGCIPVFFFPGTAYTQYTWYLPQNYTQYSVFISEDDVRDGKVNIESVLQQFSQEQIRAMREEVIKLIPKVIYADPRSKLETIEDAFDIAVKGVLERVNKVRNDIRAGRNPDEPPVSGSNTWKYRLFGTEEKHEWDHFFEAPK